MLFGPRHPDCYCTDAFNVICHHCEKADAPSLRDERARHIAEGRRLEREAVVALLVKAAAARRGAGDIETAIWFDDLRAEIDAGEHEAP